MRQLSFHLEPVHPFRLDLTVWALRRRPRGYVAPWWEMSGVTAELLLKHGFRYDHSQGYRDFVPFYARVGDCWTTIDYAMPAAAGGDERNR